LGFHQSCSVLRHVSVSSRHYFSKFRRSEVSVSSRHLEVLENGLVSAVFFISPMEHFTFSTQICRKQSKIIRNSNPKLQNVRKFIRIAIVQNIMLKNPWHFVNIRFQKSRVSSRSRHVQVSVSSQLFAQSLGLVTSMSRLGLEDFG